MTDQEVVAFIDGCECSHVYLRRRADCMQTTQHTNYIRVLCERVSGKKGAGTSGWSSIKTAGSEKWYACDGFVNIRLQERRYQALTISHDGCPAWRISSASPKLKNMTYI